MVDGPVTDDKLLARLRKAASRVMSAEEVRSQRVSFVYGNLPKDNTMTRQEVASALARIEGEPS